VLLTATCDRSHPFSPTDSDPPPATTSAALSPFALSSYFPPAEAAGGWRKSTDSAKIASLGLAPAKLPALGSYLTSLPYENYFTGVTGYSASNKAAIVIKNGWIVGEYYNQPSAATGVYYLASNGKTFTMLLVGRMASDYPEYGFELGSKLYDQRWLPRGFPLSDARKANITFDLVFRHRSGIVPEVEAAVASSAVRTEAGWDFESFTLGKDADYPVSAPLYYTPGDSSTYTKGRVYSSVAFNHFSLIFRKVTGLEPGAYLRQGILDRIGVGRMAYRLTPGMGDYAWAAAGNGLASARDFARIGYLLLHEGDWAGSQIVPATWLRRFTSVPDYPNIRSNADCRWGAKYPADMYRTTGSGQNWALVVPSLDLLLTFNGRTPSALATEIEVSSLEKLFAAVTARYVACDGTIVNDTPSNQPPAAAFGASCVGLACTFTDGSTDPDSPLSGWTWSFGDGTGSTTPSPSHAFASAGSYTVGLTVTDDRGAAGSTSRTVVVSSRVLTAQGRKVNGYEFVDLTWTGVAGANAEIFRNGVRIATMANTGAYTDATGKQGVRTLNYRVCQAGAGICTNTATVTF
jgi:CubicO group peptidase (beta-lactamase class C family)